RETIGGLFEVLIEAQVALPFVRKDALAEGGPSRESGPGASAQGKRVLVAVAGAAGESLRVGLEARGFAVTVAKEPAPANDAEALALARREGTSLALLSSLEAKPEGKIRGTDLESVQLRIELRALDA